MKGGRERILTELRKLIVGQEDVVSEVLLTLFVGGNSLIVGVPGLAKTLLVHTLARVLDLKFSRIQFTPDLMPSDITGTDLIQEDPATGRRQMVFSPGPIFANIVLADEINRTPPKTQSALLEAMQEHRVTIQGRTYTLAEPFFVFATQNPIELEGTYPLPEAQLDRFMFHIIIDHPPYDEELDVVRTTTAILDPHFERPVSGEDLVAFQRLERHEILTRHRTLEVRIQDGRGRPHDVELFIVGRVVDDDMEHEAVELRFGQRVRALELDRVLGGENEERLRERVGAPLDRDAVLLHRLEQRRLRLRRGAVDLVGEHDVGEDGTWREDHLPASRRGILLDQIRPRDVGR